METVVGKLDTNKTKTRILTKKDLELESVTEILTRCLDSFNQLCIKPQKEKSSNVGIKV